MSDEKWRNNLARINEAAAQKHEKEEIRIPMGGYHKIGEWQVSPIEITESMAEILLVYLGKEERYPGVTEGQMFKTVITDGGLVPFTPCKVKKIEKGVLVVLETTDEEDRKRAQERRSQAVYAHAKARSAKIQAGLTEDDD